MEEVVDGDRTAGHDNAAAQMDGTRAAQGWERSGHGVDPEVHDVAYECAGTRAHVVPRAAERNAPRTYPELEYVHPKE